MKRGLEADDSIVQAMKRVSDIDTNDLWQFSDVSVTDASDDTNLAPKPSSTLSSSSLSTTSAVFMFTSADLIALTTRMPVHPRRSVLWSALCDAYGLFDRLNVRQPHKATDQELTEMHDQEYIDALMQYTKNDTVDELGLSYDCAPFDGCGDYVRLVAGASLDAADALIDGKAKIAINWDGGRHHAHADEAAGYCYVNDIVLAILRLCGTYERVMYIDIDVHHGDGVEEAFVAASSVLTLNFQCVEPGFFPGTGAGGRSGIGRGEDSTVNVALPRDINDAQYLSLFRRVTSRIRDEFQPTAIVMQCGVDALAGDPLGALSLKPSTLVRAVKHVLAWQLPTLLLGGGGYNQVVAAKTFTRFTAAALGEKLADAIPEHQHFAAYKSTGFRLRNDKHDCSDEEDEQIDVEGWSDLPQSIQNQMKQIFENNTDDA